MHKLILMDDDVDLLANTVRPQLELIAEECGASVTQAIPTMLEWIPSGCSKAVGVAKVCDALGVDMGEELLALGDAESVNEAPRHYLTRLSDLMFVLARVLNRVDGGDDVYWRSERMQQNTEQDKNSI